MGWKGMIFLRFAALIAAILVFAAPAMAKERSPLRHFVWGASPEDIRKYETGTYFKSEDGSDYYVEPFEDFYKREFYRTIRYDFKDGKLWRGQYSYDRLHEPNPMSIFERAADFKIALEKIYGKPTTDTLIWKNERYRKYPSLLGSALRSGHLVVETTWKLPDTQVVMQVYNDGTVYQLTYTAEKIEAVPKDDAGNILNLPVTGKTTP